LKGWRFLFALVGFWISDAAAISLAGGAPPEVRMAAERGKKVFLKPDALDSLRSYGFESISDLNKAKVDKASFDCPPRKKVPSHHATPEP
jgi:hypothetical protein